MSDARGVAPRFIRALARRWRRALPVLSPIIQAVGSLPKASTFVCGPEPLADRWVFLHLQHSHTQPGRITINVLLSEAAMKPPPGRFLRRSEFDDRALGLYRIGTLLHGHDKWWVLVAAPGEPAESDWIAPSYGDEPRVFDAAAADITSDVRSLLSELRLPAEPA